MSFAEDDPFTTPQPSHGEQNLDMCLPPSLAVPTSSPQQLRLTLEAHLVETQKRLEGAGQLGRDLMKQSEDIQARLNDLNESGERIDPALTKKIVDLEREYQEVGRETARALLTNKVMAGAGGVAGATSPFGGANVSTPGPTFQSHGSNSPSKLNVPSRRQRNQPSKSHDLEFAAELGQGLIAEVRKLQGLLLEKEASLKNIQNEKDNFANAAAYADSQLKNLLGSEDRYKEENWNLTIEIQRLQAEIQAHKDTELKLQTQISALTAEKDQYIKDIEVKTQELEASQDSVQLEQNAHSSNVKQLNDKIAAGEADKEKLKAEVEKLKECLTDTQNESVRLRQQSSKTHLGDGKLDPFDLSLPTNDTPEHSPPASPTKQTPRHGMLENETLKSSLHHAHRMVTSLKSNIHREKTEKAEVKRLLQEARDELDTLRSGFGEKNSKRRKENGIFKKPARLNISMLGGARKSHDQIFLDEPPVDDDWEDNHDDSEAMIRNTPGSYISSVPGTDRETDSTAFESAFETANEKETTDAFETANEADATETDAYRTGVESPAYDNPTSADELTETEETSLRTLKAKASQLSTRSIKPLRLSKTRSRQRMDSITSTASTEDEGIDYRNRYVSPSFSADSDDMATPEEQNGEDFGQQRMASNPRLKLRISRARSRSSRVPSENSIFTSNLQDIGSSPTSMSDSSPIGPYNNMRSSVVGPRKSLFAELGDSPELLSNDEGEEYDDQINDSGTPSRSAHPPVPMVDQGVMTEVPYPESVFLQEEPEERPTTAVPIGPVQPFAYPDPVPKTPVQMSDRAIQFSPVEQPKACFVETGVQSDDIPLPVKPITVETATQYDAELEKLPKLATTSTAMSTMTPVGTPVTIMPVKAATASKSMATVTPISTPVVEKIAKPVLVSTAMATDTPLSTPISTNTKIRGLGDSSIDFGPSLETVRTRQRSVSPSVEVVHALEHIVPSPTMAFFGTATETLPVKTPESTPTVLLPPPPPTTKPIEALGYSTIASVSTTPITPSPLSSSPRSAPTIPIAVFDSSLPSDGKLSPKISNDSQQDVPSVSPSSSPSPSPSVERKGFFGSIFGRKERSLETEIAPRRVASSPSPSPSVRDESEDEDTIRKKDNRSRPSLPVMVSDQVSQTDMSRHDLDKILQESQAGPKRSLAYAVVDPSPSITPSLQSRASQESMARSGGRASAEGVRFGVPIQRPGSSSSMKDREAMQSAQRPPLPANHQEQIAAASQQKLLPMHTDVGFMGPPPVPVHRNSPGPAFRPRTPINDQPRRPETPSGSRGGVTPRARFSSVRSEISSPASRRSSLSSFASEIDERFNMQTNGYTARAEMDDQPTDPRVIQAITQTMIGEFLWKYTRSTGRGGISHTRHRRFFWVHPYTRTLYWSDRDPQTAGRSELRAKSVAIEAVKVVTDDNPMPPGLHRKSLVVVTPGRSLKFTAPTGARHETWFNALSYLLLRTGEQIQDETVGFDEEDIRDFEPTYSGSVGATTSMSSYYSRTSRTDSPSRNTSSLSNRPNERERTQGSMSRLGNIFRPSSGFATFSSKASRQTASTYNASDIIQSGEDLRTSSEQRDFERMENVRACCDGKHDVGTLSRKGGKKTPHSFKSRHNHAHSHG